jgi:hypothetical protein
MKTKEELRAKAAELTAKAEAFEKRSHRRFDHAPGAYVTGASGRRRSGLHKKTARAIDGSLADLREARRLRQRAATLTARADELEPERIEQRRREKTAREAVKQQESKRRRAAPILNRSTADYRLTAADWKATHRNSKALEVVELEDGRTVRLRSAMRFVPGVGSCVEEVFLTDRKERN